MEQTTWAVWASDKITPPSIKLRREDAAGQRFYWFINENKEPQTAAGITSLISKVMPESKELTNWKLGLGENWTEVLNDSANYGTLLHIAYLDRVTKGVVDNSILEGMRVLSLKNGQSYNQPEKNIYSFLKFLEDYQIEPLIFEGMLVCNFNGDYFAMTIDLLCEVTFKEKIKTKKQNGVYSKGKNKGKPKLVTVVEEVVVKKAMLVDFKSNFFEKDSKSFYESHHYQLIAGAEAVYQNFGIRVDIIANFSPNNWRTTPSYTLKNWETKHHDKMLFNAYMELARLKGLFRPSGMKFVSNNFDTSGGFQLLSYNDYILSIIEKEAKNEGIEIDIPIESQSTTPPMEQDIRGYELL